MPIENNRLLMELDKHRREINKETINPAFQVLKLENIEPVIAMCAKARADYIECLLSMANDQTEAGLSAKQVDQLKQRRGAYEELVSATNALETVIERGYVDVEIK